MTDSFARVSQSLNFGPKTFPLHMGGRSSLIFIARATQGYSFTSSNSFFWVAFFGTHTRDIEEEIETHAIHTQTHTRMHMKEYKTDLQTTLIASGKKSLGERTQLIANVLDHRLSAYVSFPRKSLDANWHRNDF